MLDIWTQQMFFNTIMLSLWKQTMMSKHFWRITKELWRIWTKLIFSNLMIHSLCKCKVMPKKCWRITKEPWMTWMLFNSNMWSLCKGEVRSKKCWGITKKPWTTWKRQCISTNDVVILLRQGGIKISLKDYQRALKDLNMVIVIKPNDVIIL